MIERLPNGARYMNGNAYEGKYVIPVPYFSRCGTKHLKVQGHIWTTMCFSAVYKIEAINPMNAPCDPNALAVPIKTPVTLPTNASAISTIKVPVLQSTLTVLVKPPTKQQIKPPTKIIVSAPITFPVPSPALGTTVKPPVYAPIKALMPKSIVPPAKIPVPVKAPVSAPTVHFIAPVQTSMLTPVHLHQFEALHPILHQ